jgi:hypothetical protein
VARRDLTVALQPELIDFTPTDTEAVVARMTVVARDRDGWINFHPWVEDDEELPTVAAGFLAWAKARGPSIPEATFVPGERKRRGDQPNSIGIQHPSGPKARLTLADKGIAIPEGWRIRADHPRRGLVIEIPDDSPLDVVLDWLVRASQALTPAVLPERWVAAVYAR